MKKIGILSDTHGLLRPEVIECLKGCSHIFHGGDINKQSILDELEKIAPIFVVRGNNDKDWAEYIPETLNVAVDSLHIFMVHNKKLIPKELDNTDLIIYGHSHKYEDKEIDGIRYVNPGSCGPRRFNQEITLAILYLHEDGSYQIEKISIPHSDKKKDDPMPTDIGLKIPLIMKDIKALKSLLE